jgi:predicted transglutaminase-like cysteine proteinase
LVFLGAAFFLLLGLGRFVSFLRRFFGERPGAEESGNTLEAPEREDFPNRRRFTAVVDILAVLYIPAALTLGVGLAGEVIYGTSTPLLFGLNVTGVALAFISIVLLLASNRLARDPYVGGSLSHRYYDRPVLSTNTALRNRGTDRFEVVLVSILAFGLGGCHVIAPYVTDLGLGAQVQTECPPTEEIVDDGQAALPQGPPRWTFTRLPNRSNHETSTYIEEEAVVPDLRLEGEAALVDEAHAVAIAPAPSVPSVWLQMAALTFTVPALESELNRMPELEIVRPSLRPDYAIQLGAPNPPPNLFGTVAQPTRMAPVIWQARVRSGFGDFSRCLDERGACNANAVDWSNFVRRAEGLEGFELYMAVNQFVNSSVRFQSDGTLEEVLDEWATPISLISQAEGDCEDFALAKFWLLEMLGVDSSDLYIVVVQDLVVQVPHAFLAVRSGSEVWLLDSRADRPLSPDEIEGVVPVVTIGDSAAYLHGRPIDPGQPMSMLWDWLPIS